MPSARPMILCVDDDDGALTFFEHALGSRGYAVVRAESGERALQVLDNLTPDLIVLDIMMPKMSGDELCRRIRDDARFAYIPIVVLSAFAGARQRALAAGAAEFLTKPVRIPVLLDKVNHHLRTHAKWRKLSESTGEPQASSLPDFARFKDALVAELGLSDDARSRVLLASFSQLAPLCAQAGMDEQRLASRAAAFLGWPFVETLSAEAVELGVLPASFSRTNLVVAVREVEGIRFVLGRPFDLELLDVVRKYHRKEPAFAVGVPSRIAKLLEIPVPVMARPSAPTREESFADIVVDLDQRYGVVEGAPEVPENAAENSEPVIRLVNWMIEKAHEMRASDIHLEPGEHDVLVRFRIDGALREIKRLTPRAIIKPLVARIKIMSDLDITERRMPQDGRIGFRKFGRAGVDVDLRVATAPMSYGEKVVMRLLYNDASSLHLEGLGFSPANLLLYRERIESPYGMILHVGPTGSGKSRTLYAALKEIQSPERNIQTIEDPVEYMLPGINQMQVNRDIGLTFERGLRSYLRQDPDVILVGEIRDGETAKVAVEAALTGHLLLSTLHTNDAPSTIVRLVEIGIEPVMVGAAIVMVCAQRLVRRLCAQCKQPYDPSEAERALIGVPTGGPGPTLYRPIGCPACDGTGYRGRIGVHELLAPDDEMRNLISSNTATTEVLRRLAIEKLGMVPLYWDAMAKVRAGIASVQDVLMVVGRPEPDDKLRLAV